MADQIQITLPETGRYAVTIDPAVLASGTVALQLRSEASGALAVNGTTAVRLAVGQNARYHFTAQASTGYGMALSGLGDGARAADVTAQVYVQAWTSAPAWAASRSGSHAG